MRIQRILVPFDFSEHSEKALRWAAAMGEKWGAPLLLLHVVAPPVYPPMMAGFMDPTQFETSLKLDAEKRLRQVAEGLQGVRAEARVEIAEPFHEICRVAQEGRSDLIVMGTHGRTGMAHVLLGSVAERVVRHAPCPVLVVGRQAAA